MVSRIIVSQRSSGSGCVSAFIGTILGPSSARTFLSDVAHMVQRLIFDLVYLCTDINTHACQCTVATGRQNKVGRVIGAFDLATEAFPDSFVWSPLAHTWIVHCTHV